MYSFLSCRPVTPDDAKLLLDWRTAPHVTQYMLTDVPYDIERQRGWIQRCQARDDYHDCILQCEGRDIGYTSITITDRHSGIGEIGIYIGDLTAPHALTMYNFVHTLNHAFFTLGLHKLVNHVVAWNGRVVKMQAFNGYRHVGVLKEHALKDGVRHDLHIFEQSAAEWAVFRKKFPDNRNWWGAQTVYDGH
ncbi:GNAT family N-acetyltransferase [Asticcacaulis sp. EMRT-3]|uniref:GNAT family N-acetyltransferase n=1 Tax=Asticcacaulis sp. EMRT-3 TaxID=3040349 RepID=UPI0024AF09CB|nr:GNAT family N-acetyltransferase [Asticcacaulis sp. EMRT-3]MDI7776138.1 GNAT family N-acetyltransferase [Asticcacaulis sp. EMRT-3]